LKRFHVHVAADDYGNKHPAWFGGVPAVAEQTLAQRWFVADRPFNVLFLCTGNSARSIMAEAILNKLGTGKFRAYSAGSQPKEQVHPETLRLLHSLGYDTSGFRSKSWKEFAKPGAPPLEFAFSVCDNAAGETCPIWPGQPMTAIGALPIRSRPRAIRLKLRWDSRTPIGC
jgi:protein-tyrosine-phosphatase